MGADDDLDCLEHVWQLKAVDFAVDGAYEEHHCARPGCDAVVFTQPPKTWRHEQAGL